MHKTINKRNAPAYLEYASDVLAKVEYRMMSLAERGLLYTMRLECWVNGRIPAATEDLALILHFDKCEIENCLTQNFLHFFELQDGWLHSPELDNYREILDLRRLAMSEGGKKGGKNTQTLIHDREASREATLEARLKPLSREDKNGREMQGNQSSRSESTMVSKENFTEEHREWVDGYEKP